MCEFQRWIYLPIFEILEFKKKHKQKDTFEGKKHKIATTTFKISTIFNQKYFASSIRKRASWVS